MTNEPYGLQLRMPFAVFDRGTSRWRTCQPSLELGNLPEQSVIWPRSGMTRSGNAFELPMWERPTVESVASSLLKTPTAQLAVNGGSQHPEKRKSGGHGPTLADEVEHLLPTPVVTDSAGARNKTAGRSNPNSQHHSGTTLTDAVTLLPTPNAARAANDTDLTVSGDGRDRPNKPGWAIALLPTGDSIDQRSNDGNESPGDQRRDQRNSLAMETSDCHLF